MLKIYSVNDPYIAYLKTIDGKVQNNYEESKPYLGILCNVGEMDWYAPLTSQKDNQASIPNSVVWAYKMIGGGDPPNKLGMIDFRNLIPAQTTYLKEFDFKRLDARYEAMMLEQFEMIRQDAERIQTKARQFLNLVLGQKTTSLQNRACDFSKLLVAAKTYQR